MSAFQILGLFLCQLPPKKMATDAEIVQVFGWPWTSTSFPWAFADLKGQGMSGIWWDGGCLMLLGQGGIRR